jgi:hypothetical protein
MKRVAIVLAVLVLLGVMAFALSPKSFYSSNHPIIQQVKANFGLINPEYAKIPIQEGDSAYTENKQVITLCLKDPDNGRYYDMNTIMYVALHELSHVICQSHGHGDEFKQKFDEILKKAASLGIYDPNKAIPTTYCNIGPGHH